MSLFEDVGAVAAHFVSAHLFGSGTPWPWEQPADERLPSDVVLVDPNQSAQLALVHQCLTLSSEMVGNFPAGLYRPEKHESKTSEAVDPKDHSLGLMVTTEPNSYMEIGQFLELIPAHGRAWGAFIAEKERNRDGDLIALHPIDPWKLTKVDRKRVDGKVIKRFYMRGHEDPFTEDEIFHVPFFGLDPLAGMSAFLWGSEDTRMSMDVRHHGRQFFRRGLHADFAVVKKSGGFIEGERERIDSAFAEVRGARNSHKTLKFAGPYEMKQLTIPLRDSQWMEAAGVSDLDICRRWMTPPEFASVPVEGGSGTLNYKNLTDDLRKLFLINHYPSTKRIERAMNRLIRRESDDDRVVWKLATEDTLRFDPKLRYELNSSAVRGGWMEPNEARRGEGFDPHAHGNTLWVDSTRVPIEVAARGGSAAGSSSSSSASANIRAAVIAATAPILFRALSKLGTRAAKNRSKGASYLTSAQCRAAAVADLGPISEALATSGIELSAERVAESVLLAMTQETEQAERWSSDEWARTRVAAITRDLQETTP